VKKVLVVDDDEDIVNIVGSLLENEGYKTVTAFNGKEAFDKALSEKPDLIIADIMMPEMDGWEFCWRVRENDQLGETPFIFLTARADVMDQIRGSEIGADDYIIKPFRKQELLKRVQNTFDVIELLRKVKTGGGAKAAGGGKKKSAAKAKKPAKAKAKKQSPKAAKKSGRRAAKR
jgi:DNA-binding response OmpR family regulator